MKFRAFLIVTLLCIRPALGEENAQAQETARLLFQEGLAHVRDGDLEAAVRDFKAAYAASPHFSVLYNIAQAQASLGMAVEAVANFEDYLAEAGGRISLARRDEVRALIKSSRDRIGLLKLSVVAPERTRIWLDGNELRPDQLDESIPLRVGEHAVLHSSGSGYPKLETVTISAATTSQVHIDDLAGHLLDGGISQVGVVCDLPGVAITIDGKPNGSTPLAVPLLVPNGTHKIGFARPGYQSSEVSIVAEQHKLALVSCNLRLDPKLSGRHGRLFVNTKPKNATVLIDGRFFTGGDLPFGAHQLRIENEGYLPHFTTISIGAGETKHYDVVLSTTPAKRRRDEIAAGRRSTLSSVLIGSGAALLLAGGGLFLWNQRRYEDWHDENGPTGAGDLNRIASIQRADDAAIGLVVFGTGTAAAGAWMRIAASASDE